VVHHTLVRPLAVFALLGFAAPGQAQETVAPAQIFRKTVGLESPWLALLRAANARASLEELRIVAREFLDDLETSSRSQDCCDYARHVYQVLFYASEAADAPLVRVFVHKRPLRLGTLPGLEGESRPLYEVFLAEDLSVRLDSVYESTPQEHPLAKESGEFVKIMLSKLGLPDSVGKAGSWLAADLEGVQPQPPPALPLAVTLSKAALPDKRASVRISHTTTVLDPAGRIRSLSAWLVNSLEQERYFREPLKPPARIDAACVKIAAEIDAAIRTETSKECSPVVGDGSGCFKAVKKAIDGAYGSAAKQQAACSPADSYPLMRRFWSMVPDKTMPARGSVTVSNAPATRFSFGLSTAYIGRLWVDDDSPRVKLSSGDIVIDSFSRLLAMGIISYVPAGYDPESVRLTGGERFRLFGGVAFAPSFGGTGGAAWSFNRYLGANVGYAYLLYDTPKPGETIGAEPSPANRTGPFELAGAHAIFVGVTYNIK
jgi:hypothetical protein